MSKLNKDDLIPNLTYLVYLRPQNLLVHYSFINGVQANKQLSFFAQIKQDSWHQSCLGIQELRISCNFYLQFLPSFKILRFLIVYNQSQSQLMCTKSSKIANSEVQMLPKLKIGTFQTLGSSTSQLQLKLPTKISIQQGFFSKQKNGQQNLECIMKWFQSRGIQMGNPESSIKTETNSVIKKITLHKYDVDLKASLLLQRRQRRGLTEAT